MPPINRNPRTPTAARRRPTSARRPQTSPPPGSAAVEEAESRTTTTVRLPVVGQVTTPPPTHLAWYAGIGLLTAIEIIEWPVAVMLIVGKVLTDNRSSRILQEFGEALDESV